jgi:DNA invertase Pin-like site-specific DNA recombinase
MNLPDYCPTCLDELPTDYPYDHTRIDLALGDQPELFRDMRRDERRQVIATGLTRGWSWYRLGRRFHRSHEQLQRLMAIAKPEPRRWPRPNDDRVRHRHALGESDRQIARALGLHRKTVYRIRHELGLAANYGSDRKPAGAAA